MMLAVRSIRLLAALIVPYFINNRKLSQGRRSGNDAQVINAAINGWTGRSPRGRNPPYPL
jgi:hypothetical protein